MSARGEALPPVPPEGIFVARLELDPRRLGDVARAVELAPVYLCGSEVRGPTAGGDFEEDVYLEYGHREDLEAALRHLAGVARRVTGLRTWCHACGRWHGLAGDGARMDAPDGAPCRAGEPGR